MFRILITTALLLAALSAHGAVLQVGPEFAYKTPSQAAADALDGDVIEIVAGEYVGDVAIWTQNDLIIRGVGGRPHLRAGGKLAGGKAIWVIKGDRVRIENLEMSGADAPGNAAAAIRVEGGLLELRQMTIHSNNMGILTSHNPRTTLKISCSEIFDNIVPESGNWGHNIYVGRIGRFELRNSHIHGAVQGHNVKSRSRENIIVENVIEDGPTGAASRLIDLSEGGNGTIFGNILRKGPDAANRDIIGYLLEGDRLRPSRLYVMENLVEQSGSQSDFVHSGGPNAFVSVQKNVFNGALRRWVRSAERGYVTLPENCGTDAACLEYANEVRP